MKGQSYVSTTKSLEMLLKVGSDHGLKSGKPLDSAGGSALCSVMTRGLGWEGRQAPEGGGVCGQRADSRASLAVLLGKNSPAVQEVLSVTPQSGRSPRGGHGNPLHVHAYGWREIGGESPSTEAWSLVGHTVMGWQRVRHN